MNSGDAVLLDCKQGLFCCGHTWKREQKFSDVSCKDINCIRNASSYPSITTLENSYFVTVSSILQIRTLSTNIYYWRQNLNVGRLTLKTHSSKLYCNAKKWISIACKDLKFEIKPDLWLWQHHSCACYPEFHTMKGVISGVKECFSLTWLKRNYPTVRKYKKLLIKRIICLGYESKISGNSPFSLQLNCILHDVPATFWISSAVVNSVLAPAPNS